MTLKVLAPAKINLSLDIVSKRPDGYHDVAMVMQAVSLYDEVSVSYDNDSADSDIKITCNVPDIPTDASNIVYKAALAFFDYTKLGQKGLSININKRIPSQAGLAGGSTDGAAVILALNRLFDTRLTADMMCEIGARVGADVPFCISGGTQYASSTGTTLSKLPNMPNCSILICKPDVSVSTAKAYALADAKPPKGFLYTDEVIAMITRRNLRGLCSSLYNEFETVLDLPQIISIKASMLRCGALGTSMSGSGSAVYGIFLNEKKAKACMNTLSTEYDKLFLCSPVKDGCKIV